MIQKAKSYVVNVIHYADWYWVIEGLQLLATGFVIWYNAQQEKIIHPVFKAFSEPYWVYLPFIIGALTVYLGMTKKFTKNLTVLVVIALLSYWATLAVLLYFNDTFQSHIPTTATIIAFVIPKILVMASRVEIKK